MSSQNSLRGGSSTSPTSQSNIMKPGTVTLVLGAQYGDEGKGKLVDHLAEKAHLVSRVQGGNNAGHTIWVKGEKLVTHLMPSGVLRESCEIALGAGVVIDPLVLVGEMEMIEKRGISLTPKRFFIDPRAHVILPYHKIQDLLAEEKRSKSGTKVGTTGRGIGPTYASKASREGPRIADLVSEGGLAKWLEVLPHMAEGMGSTESAAYSAAAQRLAPFVKDVAEVAWSHLDANRCILMEGAQGAMLDVNYGSYPFVTSSNLVSGSCAGGLGVPPWKLSQILGVAKAYSTRVGNGPYIGELFGVLEHTLREKGKEFGSTTGRERRVGWLDLVALKYLARLNGLTGLALMKSDVLEGFEQVGLVVGYREKSSGLPMASYPITTAQWELVEPVVEFCQGWSSVVESTTKLSPQLKAFVERIETFVGVPIVYVSTGPEREQGLWV